MKATEEKLETSDISKQQSDNEHSTHTADVGVVMSNRYNHSNPIQSRPGLLGDANKHQTKRPQQTDMQEWTHRPMNCDN